jgi:SAM-dependent methyltransferase
MLRYIGSQFKKPSGLLGRIISLVMIKGNSPEYDRIIPELDIRQNDRILEIGYGHGLGVDRISTMYECYITGIDFSELMYKQATRRNWKHIRNKKVELYYGDFLNWEITHNQYNKVFCLNVVYFWDQLDEPFSRIKMVLKDEGLLCMFMAHRDFLNKVKFAKDGIFNKYAIDEVVDKLNLAGFKEITFNLENNGYIIKCKK